ncbi:unnamed protein product [Didymodactylos carnosus]|uniref:Vesicle-fusing ATPase n=1 Tax=Didymodactylos carnosus TaxID=1234261 RepID=A0A814E6T4_9BILA|nr:unnamed protein product [Didymodactylos carnosus]CAF3741207.1 unnamed protein product [Didymodactylos carnosus]
MSSKFTLVNSPIFYNEDYNNYAIFNAVDMDTSPMIQVEIRNSHGVFLFQTLINTRVSPKTVGLNDRQQKRYKLKLYHKYSVQIHVHQHNLLTIINQKFNVDKTVGGYNHVFERIFGNILLSRLYPQNFIRKTGMKHSRGILLSGPPGTGKTLIARTICEVLRVKPKIVNGPETYNHLLRESEAKIRHLFDESEFDAEKYGANSDLHIIMVVKLQ